jgi:hypothetical protein
MDWHDFYIVCHECLVKFCTLIWFYDGNILTSIVCSFYMYGLIRLHLSAIKRSMNDRR